MASESARLVVDANIMVSALLGRSFPLLLRLYEAGVWLFAPVQQLAETRYRVAKNSRAEESWVDAQMERLNTVVIPLHPAFAATEREQAQTRLGPHGQPDWPVLAAALALAGHIWTNDRDFFGVGVPVWSSHNIGQLANAQEPARA